MSVTVRSVCDFPATHLSYFRGYAVAQDLSVEALLGHVVGQSAGPLEGILEALQFHISDYEDTREGEERQNNSEMWLVTLCSWSLTYKPLSSNCLVTPYFINTLDQML